MVYESIPTLVGKQAADRFLWKHACPQWNDLWPLRLTIFGLNLRITQKAVITVWRFHDTSVKLIMWYDAARKVVWLGLCFRFLGSEHFYIAFCRSVWLLFFLKVHSTFCVHTNPHRCMCMFSWRHLQFIIPWRAHMTWMKLNWHHFSPPVLEDHAERLAILLTLPLADLL